MGLLTMGNMRLLFFVLCGLALALLSLGGGLAWLGLITHKNSKRSAVSVASLAAVLALWLAQHSHFFMQNSVFDSIALLCVLWFVCFLLFWAGVTSGMKMSKHHHQDFGESSILSMQYPESRMPDQHPNRMDGNPDFQSTVIDTSRDRP